MNHTDAAIAGAGIIGLATALELAAAGLRVTVFERGQAMRESSWAAAGMLAAADPENPAALRPLSRFSIGLYPEFLAKIERLTGKRIPLRTKQTLQGEHILPPGVNEVAPEEIQSIAPGIQLSELKFFLLDEHSLDPRDIARALPEAAKAAGITLLEETAVTAISAHSESVAVRTTNGKWTAGNFINACGAWAAALADVPISPRKGQMLLVQSSEPLSVTLRTPHLYLVPRGDGRIVIGATVENAGYDKEVCPSAISALRNAAAELWPPVREARILDTWAGLRPAAADSLPILGMDEAPRRWLALGHFRNGIMLAPGSARLLRQMILNEPLGVDATPFSAERFAGAVHDNPCPATI
ncbi:MAG TPA: FAD-dependent oxidoreductase [Acidobacteriaceae bacterium]|jgi:glycine oxidase|nr:FAD-dependent oxidoreductase [Acidobacteriaceae bacterium]